ncbi:cell division/cell wall cluster transcriptional repressor MraZ [Roseomonas sp. NAR14]|uniref:Transcriptional regulator MraZ n=1 Tax=Roseomonas acroporae TaxID=2937791 RepID=A0A9X1Y391_9PROT|nr:cell division/cell wall cluster transcriptional repressor MraZ [Roseomonas acroporae]MCK8783114.1 cell division/cell wall cluster transcriptional repressor MraZ [Roseomonas acroporae]
MTRFVGTHVSKLDRKGRVSIPSHFRHALERLSNNQIILNPSFLEPCVDAWPQYLFEELVDRVNEMAKFSEEHEDASFTLFAEANELSADAEGRVVLTEPLIGHANLTDSVAFIGRGDYFQLWEPLAAKARAQLGRERSRLRGFTLPGTPRPERKAGEA